MRAVGDDDDVMEVVFAGDGGEAVDLLLGVDGASLGDDVAEGDAVGEEVVAADAAFGVAGVFVAASAECDDEWGNVFAVELDGVVEAGVEDGGWMAGVLGCTEDGDSVGRLGIVLYREGVDLVVDPDAPSGRDEKQQREQATNDESASGDGRAQIGLRNGHSYKDIVVETSESWPKASGHVRQDFNFYIEQVYRLRREMAAAKNSSDEPF